MLKRTFGKRERVCACKRESERDIKKRECERVRERMCVNE